MLNIFLTNLGKYNEGALVGEWVSLPASDEELEAVKNRIGINEHYEEWFITDYETDIHGVSVGEFDNVEELNELAEAIEENPEQVEALLYWGYDITAENIENVAYCTTIEGAETENFAFGWWYVHECSGLDIPDNIEPYFDYDSYGRDLMFECQTYTNENGDIYEYIG